MLMVIYFFFFFFFNDTATTEIYTLSLHDALPICRSRASPTRSSTGTRIVVQRANELRVRCAYRLVSTRCHSLQFVAAIIRASCSRFQSLAARFQLVDQDF